MGSGGGGETIGDFAGRSEWSQRAASINSPLRRIA